MNSLELFSGAGGLAKGLELAGFNHAALIEINQYACRSLCENFDRTKVIFGDVRDVDWRKFRDINLIAGGPPCQPFSLGGKHQAYQDDRDMFSAAIDGIEKLQPQVFVFENVKGLLRKSFADYFEYIKLRLTYPGALPDSKEHWRHHLGELANLSYSSYVGTKYNVSYRLLNAANYGVPQKRERVIIVGVRSDLQGNFLFPPETHSEDRLFWDMHVTQDYWERHKIHPAQHPAASAIESKILKLTKKYGAIAPPSKPWQTIRDTLVDLPNPNSQHGLHDHLFRDGARSYPGHTGSPLDLPAKTIKAGDHGVPGGENMIRFPNGEIRYLTVLEAKRLQTFPDDFVIQGTWGEAMRQIGNAVPVLLAKKIGTALIEALQPEAQTRNRDLFKVSHDQQLSTPR
jgi:DNA (cytosine-5)-methyltransferase 1